MMVLHAVKPVGSARLPLPDPAVLQMGAATVNRKLCTLSISVFLPRGFQLALVVKSPLC